MPTKTPKKSPGAAVTNVLSNFASDAYHAIADPLSRAAAPPPRPTLSQLNAQSRVQAAVPGRSTATMAQEMQAAQTRPSNQPYLSSQIQQVGRNLQATGLPGVSTAGQVIEAYGGGLGQLGDFFNAGNQAVGPTLAKWLPKGEILGNMKPEQIRSSMGVNMMPSDPGVMGRQYEQQPAPAPPSTQEMQRQAGFQQGGAAYPGPRAIQIGQQAQQANTARRNAADYAAQQQNLAAQKPWSPGTAEAYANAGGKGAYGEVADFAAQMLDPFAAYGLATGAGRKFIQGAGRAVEQGLGDAAFAIRRGIVNDNYRFAQRAEQQAAQQALRQAGPTERMALEMPAEAPVSGTVAKPPATLGAAAAEPDVYADPAAMLQDRPRGMGRSLTPYNQRALEPKMANATSLDARSYPTGRFRSVRKGPRPVEQIPQAGQGSTTLGSTPEAMPLTSRLQPQGAPPPLAEPQSVPDARQAFQGFQNRWEARNPGEQMPPDFRAQMWEEAQRYAAENAPPAQPTPPAPMQQPSSMMPSTGRLSGAPDPAMAQLAEFERRWQERNPGEMMPPEFRQAILQEIHNQQSPPGLLPPEAQTRAPLQPVPDLGPSPYAPQPNVDPAAMGGFPGQDLRYDAATQNGGSAIPVMRPNELSNQELLQWANSQGPLDAATARANAASNYLSELTRPGPVEINAADQASNAAATEQLRSRLAAQPQGRTYAGQAGATEEALARIRQQEALAPRNYGDRSFSRSGPLGDAVRDPQQQLASDALNYVRQNIGTDNPSVRQALDHLQHLLSVGQQAPPAEPPSSRPTANGAPEPPDFWQMDNIDPATVERAMRAGSVQEAEQILRGSAQKYASSQSPPRTSPATEARSNGNGAARPTLAELHARNGAAGNNGAVNAPVGVQYAGNVSASGPSAQPGEGAPRRPFAGPDNPGNARDASQSGFPGDAPGGAGPAASSEFPQPVAPRKTPVPGVVPKSDAAILRDLKGTVGMIQRGETKPPGFIERVKRAFEPPVGGRIAYNSKMPRGAEGAYHAQRQLVEVRRPNGTGAEAAYHEVGHAIESRSQLIQNASPAMLSELEHLGDPVVQRPTYHGVGPSDAGGNMPYQRGEGLAEYVRLWTQFPEYAAAQAPETTAAFERYLNESGQIGERLRAHQAEVQKRSIATDEALFDAQHAREEATKKLEVASGKDGIIQKHFDRFHPLRQMEGGRRRGGIDVRPTDDTYILSTTLRARAANRTTGEMERLGGILSEAGIDSEEKLREFENYLLARHYQDMRRQSLPTGTTAAMDASQTAPHAPGSAFHGAAQKLYEFQRDQVKEAVRLGLISQEQADAMFAKWQNYVPTKRLYELAAEELAVGAKNRQVGNSLQYSDPIMHLTGSEREVLSPMTSIIENTANIRLQAMKNEIGLKLAERWDANEPGIGDLINEVDDPGTDLAKANVLRVKQGDNIRFFQMSPSLFRSLHEEASLAPDVLTRINQGWANILRPLATTYNPGFSLANAVRDTLTLPFVARQGANRVLGFPFAEGLSTQVRAWMGDPQAMAAMKEFQQGAGYQDFAESLVDRSVAAKQRSALVKPVDTADRLKGAATGGLIGGAVAGAPGAAVGTMIGGVAGLKKVKGVVRAATEASEQSNRIGVYLRAKRYYEQKFPHWSAADHELAAAFEARDTLDFSRRGNAEYMRRLRQNIPFLGAHIEGNRRAVEAAITQPVSFIVAGLATGMAPEALSLWMNRDDPDFWEIPPERRKNYFYFRNPFWDGQDVNNKFIQLPRAPGVLSAPGRALNSAAEYATGHVGKGDLAERALSNTSQDLLPANLDPTQWTSPGTMASNLMGLLGPFVSTAAEVASNTDFYRNRPIVSAGAKRTHASERNQTSASTSLLAQLLADGFYKGSNGRVNVSPMELDHILYRLTAGAGQLGINTVVDPGLERLGYGDQAEARRPEGVLPWVKDALRLRYKPTQFTSVQRLDKKVKKLGTAVDEGDASKQQELEQRSGNQTRLQGLLKEYSKTRDPIQRHKLYQRIVQEGPEALR